MKDLPHVSPVCVTSHVCDSVHVYSIIITSNLTLDVHVGEIKRKTDNRLFLLFQLKTSDIPVKDILTVYMTVVRPTLE